MESKKDLGRLVGVYGIASAYLQRGVFLAVLSFLFFMAMLFAFYVRPHILYFFLSTAFLIVYLITMFSWVMQRRRSVEMYENGIRYRNSILFWDQIVDVKQTGELCVKDGTSVSIPVTIERFPEIIANIKSSCGMHRAI